MKRRIPAALLALVLAAGLLPGAGAAGGTGGTSSDSALYLDKWVEPVEGKEDTFKLVMESYATGEDGTVSMEQLPLDIVLVLDESGSMEDPLVFGCDTGEDVQVTPRGHLADEEKYTGDLDRVLFTGHRVMKDEVGTSKRYRIVYPADGSMRDIEYCGQCDGWYTADSEHEYHLAHSVAEWKPFADAEGTPAVRGKKDGDLWECDVQFYELCSRTGKEVLQDALLDFLTSLWEASNPADGRDVPNRVAIVGYGQGASYLHLDGKRDQLFPSYGNGSEKLTYDLAARAKEWAANAFYDVSKISDRNVFATWLNTLHSTGSTPTQLGIQAAQLAFENVPDDGEQRNKVMILFTDGAPGSGYVNYGPDSERGKPDWVTLALNTAREMKQNAGVTIYSVGLFPGADGYTTEDMSYDVGRDADGNKDKTAFFQNANCFLHLVSSNFPDARGVAEGEWGERNPNFQDSPKAPRAPADRHSYYMGSEDGEHLSEIFTELSQILNPGKTTVTLGPDSVMKDVVMDDFVIPDGATVKAYTVSYAGDDQDGDPTWADAPDEGSENTAPGSPLTVKIQGQTVSVTGFDFKGNYVHKDGDDPRGKKLVLEIEIKAKDGTSGGTRLPTNDDGSGIYEKADSPEPVKPFPEPHVDLPTTVTIEKVVRGSDPAQEFMFSAQWYEMGNYERLDDESDPGHTKDDSNYLHLTNATVENTLDFALTGAAGGNTKTLDNVQVGTTLTVSETEADGFSTAVTVTTANGTRTVEPEGGKYVIPVEPNMKVTFINSVYTVKVVKVEKNNEGKPLSGATFRLEKKDGDQWTPIGGEVTTGEDGIAQWGNLLAGDYRLTETQAPKGYVKALPYDFTIPTESDQSEVVTITFPNGPAPETGGPGTGLYTAAGLSLLLCGAGVYLLNRKKARG